MSLFLFLSCEPADLILNKGTLDDSSFSDLSEEDSSTEETENDSTEIQDESDNPNEENNSSDDSEGYNPEENNNSEEDWDWGEDTNEDNLWLDGDYEGFFEMYNMQSNQLLCQTEYAELSFNEENIVGNAPCETPNSSQLDVSFSGSTMDGSRGSNSQYAYAQIEGQVLVEVPSGDVFDSSFYGESQSEGGYIWTYLYFEIEIQTPNGARYYSGSLYTY